MSSLISMNVDVVSGVVRSLEEMKDTKVVKYSTRHACVMFMGAESSPPHSGVEAYEVGRGDSVHGPSSSLRAVAGFSEQPSLQKVGLSHD
jgi:hypothetical protein